MIRRLRVLLAAVLFVVGLAAAPADAAPVVCLVEPGTTSCSPAVPTLVVPTTSQPVEFGLNLWVTGAAGYDEFFVDGLEWDESILELVSIEPGALSVSFFVPPAISPGALGLTAGSFAATAGSGQLAVLHFRTVGTGGTSLTFVDDFGVAVFQGPGGLFDFAEVTGANVDVVLKSVPEPLTGALLVTGAALSVLRRRSSFSRHPAA
jgi:hypothetical protein